MLEGLEVSEVSLVDVLHDNLSFRIDAEFFKKQYVAEELLYKKLKAKKLVSLTEKIDVGFVGSMVSEYRSAGVELLQTKNIDAYFINHDGMKYISEAFDKELNKSKVSFEDILIARSGSFGKASIFLENETYNSSDIIIVRVNKEEINPYYLVSYLNSTLGINQLVKFASGGLQGHVNLTILENLKVPIIGNAIQIELEELIRSAYNLLRDSKAAYREAENILLDNLGLINWQPTQSNNNRKSFKESFLCSGRFDAEYYQPKYDELFFHLQNYTCKKLCEIVDIQKSIEPGSDSYQLEGIPFIRVANIFKTGLTKPEIFLDREKFADFELRPKKDTILLTKDGSVGIAYKVEEDLDAITSSALLHLSINDKDVRPDYLCLILNSVIVSMQAERDAGGSIIQHWKPDEIKQVVIPILGKDVQETISDKVNTCFMLQNKSKKLLNITKYAVEIAIEKDEETALKFIKES